MKFDLSKFKKAHEDADSVTMQHRDGHSIKIAKKALSGHMQRKLGELKFADGGQVPAPKGIAERMQPGTYDYNANQQHYPQARHLAEGGMTPNPVDPQKAKDLAKGVNAGGPSISEMGSNVKKAFGFANGGIANLKEPTWGGPGPEPQVREMPEEGYERLNKAGQHPHGVDMVGVPEPKKYADGGEVNSEPSFFDRLFSAPQAPSEPQPFSSEPAPIQEAPAEQAAPSNVAIPAPAPVLAAAPVSPMGGIEAGVNQETKGIQGQATAQGQLGQQQSQAYQQQQDSQQQLMKHFQESNEALMQERNNVVADYKAGHIDPKHFVNSMGTGSKVATAIGLLLSGLGSGGSGQQNAALDFLNKNIDRDIDAQKAEMEKKDNLLKMNMQQFGNLRDATTMTRLMMADNYMAKLEQAKANATTPLAKANADIAIGQLQQKYAPMQAQLAQTMAIRQGVQSGSIPVERAVPYLVPQEHQKEVFAELGKAHDAAKNEQIILQNFDKASKENTIIRTGAGLLREPASSIALQNMMLPLIKDLEGRVNEYEFQTIKKLLPAPGDSDSKLGSKREGLINFINQRKAAPTATAYGISVPKTTNFKKLKP